MKTQHEVPIDYCVNCTAEYVIESNKQAFCSEDCRIKYFEGANKSGGIRTHIYGHQLSIKELSQIILDIPVTVDKIETDLGIPKGTISKSLRGLRTFPKKYTWKLNHYRNYGEAPFIEKKYQPIVLQIESAIVTIGKKSISIDFD